jgi:hypothetical protein
MKQGESGTKVTIYDNSGAWHKSYHKKKTGRTPALHTEGEDLVAVAVSVKKLKTLFFIILDFRKS